MLGITSFNFCYQGIICLAFLILLGLTYCPYKNAGFYLPWNLIKSFRWWWVGGWSKVTLLCCFGPKPKFCSFDLDLDQAEQFQLLQVALFLQKYSGRLPFSKIFRLSSILMRLRSSSIRKITGVVFHLERIQVVFHLDKSRSSFIYILSSWVKISLHTENQNQNCSNL